MPREETTWWGRNWWWVLGGGCLLPLCAVGGCFAALIGGAGSLMRSVEPYDHALSLATSNPEVTAALGDPIEAGWLFQGNINFSNDDAVADFSFPISGPRGKARIHVEATKVDGVWSYHEVKARINGGPTVDLLSEPDPTADSASLRTKSPRGSPSAASNRRTAARW